MWPADSTKDETPSADSLTNNVKEPSTEEGETTAGEKKELERLFSSKLDIDS